MDLSGFWEDTKKTVKYVSFGVVHFRDGTYKTITFSQRKAVEYALTHWSVVNLDFPLLAKGEKDCTNFVSQCWNVAGIPQTGYWHHMFGRIDMGEFTQTTYSWVNAEEFASYMTKGYCWISYNSNDVRLGDVIQWWDGQYWHHSAIITKINQNGIHYTAHSDPNKEKPLSEVYPKTWDKTNERWVDAEPIRFLCPYNSV